MNPHRYLMNTIADMLSAGLSAPHELFLDLGDCRISVRSNSQKLMGELDDYFGSFVAAPGPVDVSIVLSART